MIPFLISFSLEVSRFFGNSYRLIGDHLCLQETQYDHGNDKGKRAQLGRLSFDEFKYEFNKRDEEVDW